MQHGFATVPVYDAIWLDFKISAYPWQPAIQARLCLCLANEFTFIHFNESHHVCFWQSNFVCQLTGTFEHFFHSHTIHRERTIIGYAKRFTRVPQCVINRQHTAARAVQLPAEFSDIRHPKCPHLVTSHGNFPGRHPAKISVIKRCITT